MNLPIFTLFPFIVILLSIAIFPLFAEKWWALNRHKLILSIALGLPVVGYLISYGYTHKLLEVVIFEYIPFIILLGSLYVISGGILLTGDIEATPKNNTLFLGLGTLLASLIGTTGAAMLLIRPFLDTNKERTLKAHSIVFFIFLVCNIGGSLTPLGDPPLFLGYLMGVPFSWTLSLWPEWAFTSILLLIIYFVIDTFFHRKEPFEALKFDHDNIAPLKLEGSINFLWLVGIILAVACVNAQTLSWFPKEPDPYISASYIAFLRELIMLGFTALSLITTPRHVRKKHEFTMHPINEVACLFLGIFLTMIPALIFLEKSTHLIKAVLVSPAHFFWATGLLSSLLDNAPTYVAFFTAAGIDPTMLSENSEIAAYLAAVSLGAVFMGAITYIGNGPNFMVKAVAEGRGVNMPSFFGYMIYSVLILVPIFALVTFLFI